LMTIRGLPQGEVGATPNLPPAGEHGPSL
jgi:hypothetical protein